MHHEFGREKFTLKYPADMAFEAKEILSFLQEDGYTRSFQEFGLTDDEQRSIEAGIMISPLKSPVIDGTGGMREFQFCIPSNKPGSLHISAFYAYFPESGMVALVDLIETGEVGPMTDEEKATLKDLFERVQQEFPPLEG